MANTFYIHPPLAGISRQTGKQRQAPYTCVESKNFWPVDVASGANLTATRSPQRQLAFPSYPCNMLAQLNLPSPNAFAAANGVLYKRNNTTGVYAAISSSYGITSGRAVFASPFFKQLLIANNGAPLHYDNDIEIAVPGTGLQPLVATAGFVPTDCRLTMNFQSRVWLGGSPTDELGPHVFAACRADDIFDWDFGAADVEAAYISTGDNRGLITEPLTAMVAITTDQAIIGCEEEVWSLSGDPRDGGRFDRASNQTGILGQNAFAITPRGFYFLAHDGFMLLARNDYGNLAVTPVSKDKIPSSLLNIAYDPLNPTVCMAYSSRNNAVYLTVRNADNPQSWAYFLDSGGFYEQPIQENPFVMFPFESLVTEDACGVMFGGSYLGQFDRTATEAITSSQIIGPVQISSNSMEANIITQGSMILASGTNDDDATVELYTGPTGEVAVNRAKTRTDQYSYKDTVGSIRKNNRNILPTLRGASVTMRIDQTASTRRVVFEDFVGKLVQGGTNMDDGQTAPVVTPPNVPNLLIDIN